MSNTASPTEVQALSMVEQVARALARDFGFDDVDMLDHRTIFNSNPVLVDTQPIWRRFEKAARAAIAAMREPTEGMIQAALAANAWAADGSVRGMDKIRKKYRERMAAMVDAALGKPPHE